MLYVVAVKVVRGAKMYIHVYLQEKPTPKGRGQLELCNKLLIIVGHHDLGWNITSCKHEFYYYCLTLFRLLTQPKTFTRALYLPWKFHFCNLDLHRLRSVGVLRFKHFLQFLEKNAKGCETDNFTIAKSFLYSSSLFAELLKRRQPNLSTKLITWLGRNLISYSSHFSRGREVQFINYAGVQTQTVANYKRVLYHDAILNVSHPTKIVMVQKKKEKPL